MNNSSKNPRGRPVERDPFEPRRYSLTINKKDYPIFKKLFDEAIKKGISLSVLIFEKLGRK